MCSEAAKEHSESGVDFEARCRAYYLAQDLGVYYTGVVLLSLPIVLFSYSDYLLYGTGASFQFLAGVRVTMLAATTGVFLRLPQLLRRPSGDKLITIWSLHFSAVVIFINSTRPPEYIQHAMLDVLILMTLYFLFPLPAPLHAIAPLAFSVGNLIMIFTVKTSVSSLETNVLVITYVLGNALGLYTARRMHRYRRSNFLALDQEKKLRRELEEAMRNLKLLQGMLPICAHCKKVRDDQGYWTQIEQYIHTHSEAEFTHGICPDCIKEHFGDVELAE
ncbi:MAG: hypothetical protein JNK74_17255 [Candidatus Hydrogenedentes bacterium]|nr:hypothetical protein [Candidatus Hydrogenedentota bacterium]